MPKKEIIFSQAQFHPNTRNLLVQHRVRAPALAWSNSRKSISSPAPPVYRCFPPVSSNDTKLFSTSSSRLWWWWWCEFTQWFLGMVCNQPTNCFALWSVVETDRERVLTRYKKMPSHRKPLLCDCVRTFVAHDRTTRTPTSASHLLQARCFFILEVRGRYFCNEIKCW